MAVRYDIALNNNDLLIRDGDFVVAESDIQHCIDTMNAFPGWWKEFPLDGVGIFQYTKSNADVQTINRKVQIELTSDGYNPRNPVVTLSTDGKLIINPNIEEV